MKKLLLLTILVMSLTACSQKVITKYSYKTTPSELLQSPCDAERHGDGSTLQLGKAYISGVACIKKHQEVLEGAREYNRIIKEGSKRLEQEY